MDDKKTELRKQAEGKASHVPEDLEAISPAEMRQTLHELRVHQIELELQKEELLLTQAELETSRARYFDLYELAPVGYVTVSQKGLIPESNLTAATMLGVLRDVPGSAHPIFTKFVHSEDQDIYYRFRKQLLETGKTQACELRMVKKDGQAFWAHLEASIAQAPSTDSFRQCPAQAWQGGEPAIRIVISDISPGENLKEANRLLDFSRYAESVVETVRESLLVLDADLKIISANPSFYRTFQVNPDETMGSFIYDLGNGQWNILQLRELLETILPLKTTFDDYEVEHDFTTIGKRTMLLNARQIHQVLGKERIILLAIEDITERKRVEEERSNAKHELEQRVLSRTQELAKVNELLQKELWEKDKSASALYESEKRYRSLFSKSFSGIFIMSTEGKLLEINDSFARMHGYSIQEMLQINIDELDTPETSQLRPERLRRVFAGEDLTFEAEHYHKDGHVLSLAVSASLLSLGEASYIQGIHYDMTERKQAEQTRLKQREELYQRSRLATVGEFTASISHEVNQPLASIMNNARAAQHFLSAATPAINEAQDALQDIFNDSLRASEVILHLRSFLKTREANPVILDINAVLAEVLSILHHEIVDRHVSVTLEVCPDMPPVEGERIELQQVIMNLILNGCDAMVEVAPQQRKMHIRTAVDKLDGIIIAAIQDSGTGLNMNEFDRVFEPYYTTKREGLGIGLSISKSILAAHGGRIWAENNAECGATFYFTLPIYKEKVL